MRKIRVTAMDEDTAELLDETFLEVDETCTEVRVMAGFDEATLVIGKR